MIDGTHKEGESRKTPLISTFSQLNANMYTQSNFENLIPHKQKVYEDFLAYFGDRVVFSELSLWVLKFWRLDSANVFLFNNGDWQVNLNMGSDFSPKDMESDEEDKQQYKKFQRENPNRNTEKNQGKKVNEKTKRREGAVLIDRNNIGWWLPPISEN